jgi:hypothetical protein
MKSSHRRYFVTPPKSPANPGLRYDLNSAYSPSLNRANTHHTHAQTEREKQNSKLLANDPQTQAESIFDFIAKVCLNERYIEMRRQILCDSNDFETYVAFSRLSRNDQKGITPIAIY